MNKLIYFFNLLTISIQSNKKKNFSNVTNYFLIIKYLAFLYYKIINTFSYIVHINILNIDNLCGIIHI